MNRIKKDRSPSIREVLKRLFAPAPGAPTEAAPRCERSQFDCGRSSWENCRDCRNRWPDGWCDRRHEYVDHNGVTCHFYEPEF